MLIIKPIKNYLFLYAATLVMFSSCSKSEIVEPIDVYDCYSILNHISENVITATYIDLHERSLILIDDVELLQSDPTQINLETARQSWRETRVPWKQSEAFLFGPVQTAGIDPNLDSWPLNIVDIELILSSTDILTEEYINDLEVTQKGFHTIEYLLWGEFGLKTIEEFTEREFQYLTAAALCLEKDAFNLKNSWASDGDNFQINISEAGEITSIYVSQQSAMQELINGMIRISLELAEEKIGEPLEEPDISIVESRFSANTKEDFINNIRGIENIYYGNYIVDGAGLTDYFLSEDPDIDLQFKENIQNAIDLIEAIPGSFATAMYDFPLEVELAQDAVMKIHDQLENKIKPLIDDL